MNDVHSGDIHGGDDPFGQQVRAMRRRVAELEHRASQAIPGGRGVLEEALGKLGSAVESMAVAQEELRVQNDSLLEAQRDIEAERRRYVDLFEFAPDGYLLTDGRAVIREANQDAARMLGVPQDFLAGKPLAALVEDGGDLLARLSALPAPGLTPEWTARLRPRGGEPLDVALSVTPIHDAGGERVGLRWLLRDVSERLRAQAALARQSAALERANRELEARNAEQESFVYTVSHDLRSPLLSIQGMGSLLEEAVLAGDTGEARYFLGRVQANVEKMGALLDDLLALSRAGRDSGSREALDLGEVVGSAVQELESRIERRGARVELPAAWPKVYYGRSEAYQLVANLLDRGLEPRRGQLRGGHAAGGGGGSAGEGLGPAQPLEQLGAREAGEGGELADQFLGGRVVRLEFA